MNVWLERLAAEAPAHRLLEAVELIERAGVAVKLRHSSSLGFAGGEIERVDVTDGAQGPAAVVTGTFFGLSGAMTPLALYFAEEAARDDEQGANIRGVLELFDHRLLGLLLASVRELDHPRSFRADGTDPWTAIILAYLGVAGRLRALSPPEALRLAPILASGVRSPEMFEAALRIVLEPWLGRASVRCEPLAGDWVKTDGSGWARLGSATSALGSRAVLGVEILHRASTVRIVVGPLAGEEYRDFLAGGPAHVRVCELVGLFAQEPLRIDMSLEIHTTPENTGRLGQTRIGDDCWLASAREATRPTQILVPLTGETTL